MDRVAQVVDVFCASIADEHNPASPRRLMEVDSHARLEPDAVLVDQAHAGHWHVKNIRRHLGDMVEGPGSGGVSRIWYCRSAFKRSASFSGLTVFMAPTSEQSQTLAGCGRRSQVLTILANNRNFTIFRSPALWLITGNSLPRSFSLWHKSCVLGLEPISQEQMMRGSRDQSRIQPVDPDQATGAIRQLLADIRTKFALVPNLFRVFAIAPAALEGLVALGSALALRKSG